MQSPSLRHNVGRFRAFLELCVESGWAPTNVARKVKTPKVKRRPTLPLSPQQVQRLLDACRGFGRREWESDRMEALVLVMRYSGLAIGDAARLRRNEA